jgi:hypothetical protein
MIKLTASAITVALLAAAPGATATQQRPVPLQRILTDGSLWDRDFAALLANLPSWRAVGESSVVVFRDRALGGTPYTDRDRAQLLVARMRDALSQAKGTPNPQFAALLDAALKAAPNFETTVVTLGEDGSTRVAWTGAPARGLRFLADTLSVARVQERLGPPETVTTYLVPSDRDHRPAVLTLRAYAGGAVVFAESNWAPRPGFVDRVILDPRVISAALFRTGGGQ